MKKYIALLRGINISGKNKVLMPLLKAAFEELGFLDVSTYINSGNVIFKSDVSDKNELINKCKATISDTFMLDIAVAVISSNELSDALDNAPEWWDKASVDKEIIHQAIFLIPHVTVEEVFKAVGEAKAEYEKVFSYSNVIFWSAPRETLSRTRWYKIASSSVNDKVTIRSANTAKKLLSLSRE